MLFCCSGVKSSAAKAERSGAPTSVRASAAMRSRRRVMGSAGAFVGSGSVAVAIPVASLVLVGRALGGLLQILGAHPRGRAGRQHLRRPDRLLARHLEVAF